ncbi:MAG: GNAT family N-acetyltransferase [bacterium]
MKFQEINQEAYESYWNQALFKTFFHEAGWHQVLAQEFDFKFRYFIYEDKLVLPLAEMANGQLFSLPFSEYGGPLPLAEEIDFNQFHKDLLEQFPQIKLRFHPYILAYFSQISGLGEGRFKTYWLTGLEKKSQAEIAESFRKSLRQEIVKAENNNLIVKVCHDLAELKKYHQLYVKVIKGKGNLVLPFACFEYLFKNDNAEILLAYQGKKLIAGSVFLYYNGFVHYYLNAASDKRSNANYLLLWHKIKNVLNKYHQVFDFGSAGQESSLAIFKRGWGTQAKPILEIGFDQKQESKSLARSLFKLLPDAWAIRLSKKLARKVF